MSRSIGRIKRGPMAADVFGRDFTQVYNKAARDKRLSRRARGLLVELLSHRDGFGVSIEGLVAQGPEGRDAIRSAIAELEKYGYLHRERERDAETGRLGDAVYSVTDMPDGVTLTVSAPWSGEEEEPAAEEEPAPEEGPRSSEPASENPTLGFPTEDKPTHKKTTPKNTSEEEEDGAPTARSAGDARRAPDRSSARGTQGGSAAANDKRKSSRNRLTPEQAKAVAVVEQALPETLTELLPHRQLTNAVRELIARELANRTPEQLAGRVARRWFFHGYQRAVLAGEGLRRPVAVAHALVRPGECTDASCEDGVLIDTGADCRSCQERRENRRRNGGTGPVPAQRSGGRDGWVCRACERPGRGEAPESGECSRCWAEARDAVRRLLDAPAPAPQEDPEEIAEQAVGGSEEAPGSADTPEAPEDAEQAAERIRDREETERLKAQIAAQNPGLAEIARKANH